MQTAVQAQTGEEIDIGRLYAGYRRFVDSAASLRAAGAQLGMLNQFAEHYRALATGTGSDPIAVFGRRIAVWDASPTHALALRVATSSLSADEKTEIFGCIESYLVRRAICGLSRKNYNKVFAQQLRRLIDGELTTAAFRAALKSLTGEASRWPTDDEFRRNWIEGEAYPGRLDAVKLRAIFHRLETAMRSEKTEESVPLTLDALDIDHIMPKSWYSHWPLTDGTSVTAFDAIDAQPLRFSSSDIDPRTQAILDREDAVRRIGNLTIVHLGVNRALQNHGFEEKRKALFDHSNLQLNRALMHSESWDQAAIAARGEALFEFAIKIWPGPELS
ncbi:HNH endonuclease family protein [Cupriavidus respiraculi]|uniref:HNH endonuclease family protein n=1 Tax=Cupriavidus respiraculi TaxID=195930 RepID=UPI001C950D4D|nr:HNH endonuclease family protein [Cupriavidus respiraculi]MBY4949849.1 HNH endonuclease family protein [Cupriavidus respiraculi]